MNAVTPLLFTRYPGFAELSVAEIKEIEKIVKSTGFYKNKAKNIIAMSMAVMKNHNGTIPSNLESLTKLPGIGRKSANVILSIGYNIPALAVDTHVMRIAFRLGYTDKADDPFAAEMSLTRLIPKKKWKMTHLILIRHGRKICIARKPLCEECPVNQLCISYGKFS